jgi:hypothetical protein
MAAPVRALNEANAVKPPDRVGHQWAGTEVVGDTRWLLHRVAAEAPADAPAAQALRTRLKVQAAFHQRYARADAAPPGRTHSLYLPSATGPDPRESTPIDSDTAE